jgi:hypothetical protein
MFQYRNKEYASASEALDDYIRNFDIKNYENELSFSKTTKNDHLKNNYKQQSTNNNSSNLINLKPVDSTTNAVTEPDDVAIKKIESLINVLSKRIDDHKKQTQTLTTTTTTVDSEIHNDEKPTLKLFDMKIKQELDLTNKTTDSIKESLVVFESINKKLIEATASNKKLNDFCSNDKNFSQSSSPLQSTSSSTSSSKTNFINECLKIIDTDEIIRFPTLDSKLIISNNNKFNDSGLDSLLNEIKDVLK